MIKSFLELPEWKCFHLSNLLSSHLPNASRWCHVRRCIHSLVTDDILLQTWSYLQATPQQWFGSPVAVSEGAVAVLVGSSSDIYGFVGTVEGTKPSIIWMLFWNGKSGLLLPRGQQNGLMMSPSALVPSGSDWELNFPKDLVQTLLPNTTEVAVIALTSDS